MIKILFQSILENIRIISVFIITCIVLRVYFARKEGKLSITDSLIDKLKEKSIDKGVKKKIRQKYSGKRGLFRKYDELVETILYTFNLRWLGVEYFSIIVVTIGFISFILLSVILMDLYISFVLTMTLSISTIVYLYIYALKEGEQKAITVINFSDICSDKMNKGAYVAIKENRDFCHELIKKDIEDFVKSIEKYNVDVVVALKELKGKLGSGFNEFYETAVEFEKSGKVGVEEAFKDVVDKNGKIKQDIIRKDIVFNNLVKQTYIVSFVVSITLGIFFIVPSFRELLLGTGLGRFILTMIIISYPTVTLGIRRKQYTVLGEILKIR